jgi:hypothetical protein
MAKDSPEAAKKVSFNKEIAKISKKGIQVPYHASHPSKDTAN